MRPLRFCMVTTFFPPFSFGGDAIQVERLASALADRGHHVTVLHSTQAHRLLARGSPTSAEPNPRLRVVSVDEGFGRSAPIAAYSTGRPLLTRRRLERELADHFDVIHFHNPSLVGGPGILGIGEAIKLYTAHEQWLVCPTHVLWKYRRRVCELPTCWRCSLSYGRPPQLWRSTSLLEDSLHELDALIVPSATSAALHSRFSSLVRIERIPHFLRQPTETHEPPNRPPYFLYVGRLESIKGVDRLIDAFARRTSPELLIAGAGTLESSLRRRATRLPHVRFLGWVNAADLDDLYRGALAVVLPTAGHEAFGLTPIEAFARGTPAIVHDFGALAELIEESSGGIAYSTAAELDEALDALEHDPALRSQLGEHGRAAYLARWTPEAHLRAYLGLIAELARERGDAELAVAAATAAANGADAA